MTKTTIEQDWLECLDLCAASGRMEEYLRNLRLPKYAPSEAIQAGRKFASTHRDGYSVLIERLAQGNDHEKLCAFECLEYMCCDFDIGSVPQELFDISEPLPPSSLRNWQATAMPRDSQAPLSEIGFVICSRSPFFDGSIADQEEAI
ncbi:hypothetical protein [Lysobacter antibioticus]|uniref:hypothetical protein n=1 Tax=Lysobacter TaxID=68 RepID=UPI0004D02BCE|nr:hypothetical protein [Lysobacter antibioticus]